MTSSDEAFHAKVALIVTSPTPPFISSWYVPKTMLAGIRISKRTCVWTRPNKGWQPPNGLGLNSDQIERLLVEICWKGLSLSFSPGNFLRRVIQFLKLPKVFNPQLVFTLQLISQAPMDQTIKCSYPSGTFLDGDAEASRVLYLLHSFIMSQLVYCNSERSCYQGAWRFSRTVFNASTGLSVHICVREMIFTETLASYNSFV